jgi:hypothetical protein
MSRPRDMQIFWVVFFAGVFWVAIWQHDFVSRWWDTISKTIVARTSSLRRAPAPEAAPAEDPLQGKAKRVPGSKD